MMPPLLNAVFARLKALAHTGSRITCGQFALLVYVSAWIKCHYPDVFLCALLNAQPMGFYAPSQLVAEAKKSGVNILPVDVNHSDWDHRLEPDPLHATGRHSLRLGLRLVKGLRRHEGERIAASRAAMAADSCYQLASDFPRSADRVAFTSLTAIVRLADISKAALQAIADADGFSSLGMTRRQALWAVRGLDQDRPLPLFAHAGRRHDSLAGGEPDVALPIASAGENVAEDYRSLGLSLKAHPLDLLAKPLTVAGWQRCGLVHQVLDGKRVRIAGLVTMRQRPGTASGTVF